MLHITGTVNKRKELEHILNGGNFVAISNAIKNLREESPFSGAVSLLVAHYNRNNNSSVRNLISSFLNDLKDQSSCAEVIEEIRKEVNSETLRMLVSSCWQSGLDYSGYSGDFAKLFITGNYMTALECFTVLESSLPDISQNDKAAIRTMIRNANKKGTGDKKALADELISILE